MIVVRCQQIATGRPALTPATGLAAPCNVFVTQRCETAWSTFVAYDPHGLTPSSIGTVMQGDSEYSALFYVMLLLGIVGLVGFLLVAVGAGAAVQ